MAWRVDPVRNNFPSQFIQKLHILQLWWFWWCQECTYSMLFSSGITIWYCSRNSDIFRNGGQQQTAPEIGRPAFRHVCEPKSYEVFGSSACHCRGSGPLVVGPWCDAGDNQLHRMELVTAMLQCYLMLFALRCPSCILTLPDTPLTSQSSDCARVWKLTLKMSNVSVSRRTLLQMDLRLCFVRMLLAQIPAAVPHQHNTVSNTTCLFISIDFLSCFRLRMA